MIHIFYNNPPNQLTTQSFNNLLQQLPEKLHFSILQFKNPDDRQRSVVGKLLLQKALKSIGLVNYSLNDMEYTDLNKPYFNNTLDFNISHSGAYTICAISKTDKIGIDVEEIKDIPLTDFENEFSKAEMKSILESGNVLRSFFTLWTQKEAFLKAIGKGLHIPLNQIAVTNNRIVWENHDWFLHEIRLDEKYVCHLATNSLSPNIHLEEIVYS